MDETERILKEKQAFLDRIAGLRKTVNELIDAFVKALEKEKEEEVRKSLKE